MPELNPPTYTMAATSLTVGEGTVPAEPTDRRHAREQVEMLARFRRDLVSMTVVLKDLTPLGARIEGVGPLEADEMVTLTLPECRPMIAFVAWGSPHGAGLEFVQPLPDDLFAELVAEYGLSSEGAAGS